LLRDWRTASVTGVPGAAAPPGVATVSPTLTIFGATWPTAAQIGRTLADWHFAKQRLRAAYERIPQYLRGQRHSTGACERRIHFRPQVACGTAIARRDVRWSAWSRWFVARDSYFSVSPKLRPPSSSIARALLKVLLNTLIPSWRRLCHTRWSGMGAVMMTEFDCRRVSLTPASPGICRFILASGERQKVRFVR